MTYRLLCAAAALTLSACGDSEGPKGNMTAAEVADEMKEVTVQPGEWEVTSEIVSMDAPNMPPEVMKTLAGKKTTMRNCITPEEAAKPEGNFLAVQQESGCTYQDWSMSGGTMRGTLTCQKPGTPIKTMMKMNGEYAESSYEIDMEMTQSGLPGGQSMTTKTHAAAKRIGDCPGGKAG